MKSTRQLLLTIVLMVAAAMTIDCVYGKPSDESEAQAQLAKIRTTCKNSANLSEAEYKMILDHKLFTPDTKTATTPKSIQCYCLCYLNESKIFLNDAPNEKYLREMLPILINDAKKANAAIEKCGKLVGADACEKGFNYELCLVQETKLYMY